MCWSFHIVIQPEYNDLFLLSYSSLPNRKDCWSSFLPSMDFLLEENKCFKIQKRRYSKLLLYLVILCVRNIPRLFILVVKIFNSPRTYIFNCERLFNSAILLSWQTQKQWTRGIWHYSHDSPQFKMTCIAWEIQTLKMRSKNRLDELYPKNNECDLLLWIQDKEKQFFR